MISELILTISGGCDIANAGRHHAVILDALQSNRSVIIRFEESERADISFVQLLVSSQQAFEGKKLSFRIADAPPNIRSAIARAGFNPDDANGRIRVGSVN